MRNSTRYIARKKWSEFAKDINRFTHDDIVCALEMFNEDYVTFPRDDIGKLSGLVMPVNKRNGRKQEQHLTFVRGIREVKSKMGEKCKGAADRPQLTLSGNTNGSTAGNKPKK